MKSVFPCTLILLMLLAQPLLGQTVRLRSGEHADFTRLVLDLPERADWTLEEVQGGVSLTFPGRDFEYDVSRVFDRIPRTRLQAVAASDTGLRLDLGCDCPTDVFFHDGSMLVVDIRDRPEGATDRQENHRDAKKRASGRVFPARFPRNSRPSAAVALLDRHLPTLAVAPRRFGPVRRETGRQAVLQAGRLVFRGLDRAASQGLLSRKPRPADGAPLTARIRRPSHAEDEKRANADRPAASGTSESTATANLAARTSMDRDFLDAVSVLEKAAGANACPPPSRFDVAAWSGPEGFEAELGRLRTALLGEFDQIDENAIIDLAQFYLHYGFGAEAAAVLRMSSARGQAVDILQELSRIVDGRPVPRDSALGRYAGCGDREAFWSFMGVGAARTGTPLQTEAVIRGFVELPGHLRATLGPTLSKQFAAAGHPAAAHAVRRILARGLGNGTEGAPGPGTTVQSGPGAADENDLRAMIDANDKDSPDALIRLIDLKLNEKAQISYDLAQLAGSFAQEYRELPLGDELSRVYLLALASSGAFDEAFDEYHRLRDDIAADRRREIRDGLFHHLTDSAPSAVFLRHVFADSAGGPAGTASATLNGVIERLLQYGFAARAQVLAALPAPETGGRARAVLRARIALERGLPQQSESHLMGHEGRDVARLRARARDLAGDHRNAYELFMQAGAVEQAAEAAFRAEDWDALRDIAGTEGVSRPDLAAIAESMGQPTDAADAPGAGTLAAKRTLIADSEEMRGSFRTLFDQRGINAGLAE
ncbi:hypothetical protein [Roseovarius sp. SYSU LYC5161]|uniref:hypothetical protein n=1 Tax=Roseovarius halophilus (ex Wu et al. 2025) TaxID=3376060 RepID=UPI00399A7190